MKWVHREYQSVEKELDLKKPLDLENLRRPLVIVPVTGWTRITQKALRFALEISQDVQAVHIHAEDDTDELAAQWNELVEQPAKRRGLPPPKLEVLPSPYRLVLTPIRDYIIQKAEQNPDRQIAVIIPEKIQERWYHYLLHNKRGTALKALLYFGGNQQIVVMNVPWYFGSSYKSSQAGK